MDEQIESKITPENYSYFMHIFSKSVTMITFDDHHTLRCCS
ncbi:hypothetical protein HMPREF0454_03722 [Hafnia alvei ATCC 51873]|uniref:Uncharacterized protein n=1 Tax=Hafnia alvei ATCC 51873 TaxID=1002364 RepID=G9YAU6_HAFAL|nr:hypothetical protein HMPREF0454_03722 [Hafnia alvei ATCC 51873]